MCDFRWFLLWVLGWLFSGAGLLCDFLVWWLSELSVVLELLWCCYNITFRCCGLGFSGLAEFGFCGLVRCFLLGALVCSILGRRCCFRWCWWLAVVCGFCFLAGLV